MAGPASRPTLTVTLCNYNHGAVVSRAISAVLAQSRPPDEFVIVDDGSTDDSVSRIEALTRDDPRVRLIRHPRNRGLHAANETALHAVTGEYLYMAASDDYVLPDFFSRAMALAERYPQAGIVFGRQMRAWPSGVEELQDSWPGWSEPTFAAPPRFLEEYLKRAPALHSLTSATIYRRACLTELGGMPPEISYWVDTFTARAVALKHGAGFIPEPCAVFSFNPTGFCAREIRDLDRALAPIPHVAERMRSPALAERFPADYVRDWEHAARRDVIMFHCWLHHLFPAKEEWRRRQRALASMGMAGRAVAGLLTLPTLGRAVIAHRRALRSLRDQRGAA